MRTTTPPSAPDRLMSVGDLSRLLSVSRRQVERLTASRAIRAVRLGRLVRYRETDVAAYIRGLPAREGYAGELRRDPQGHFAGEAGGSAGMP